MAPIIHRLTTADELMYQKWWVSLSTVSVLQESARNALACSASFQRAIRDNESDLNLLVRAARHTVSNPEATAADIASARKILAAN